MENSMTSMSKPISPKATTVVDSDDEESSWTFYFEDFLCHNNNDEQSSFSSGYENPSLVSDAASAAAVKAKKLVDNDDHQVGGCCLDRSVKNLSFKKRKTKAGLVNDALEDTASSPVNSPKVFYFNQLDMNRKEKDNVDIPEQKGNTSGQIDERSEMGIVGRDRDYTELKKRGLCLVPVSMLANYLG